MNYRRINDIGTVVGDLRNHLQLSVPVIRFYCPHPDTIGFDGHLF